MVKPDASILPKLRLIAALPRWVHSRLKFFLVSLRVDLGLDFPSHFTDTRQVSGRNLSVHEESGRASLPRRLAT